MREIKFRAWDKHVKKWRVVTSLAWYKPDTGKSGLCGVVIVTDSNHDQFMPIDEVELVEYTGLQDKNGVEIYEGDIIRQAMPWSSRELEVAPVYWDDEKAAFGYKGRRGYTGWVQGGRCEVIGNIYENPELLKK